ncbi:DUF1697 domain-containing protein [Marinirhabdus gelatinilytica]|uniref:Uncharacterized protein (DUF1697 family) n=1 Tax=Marinirhabdus gelatinilytica TaxID=1703343 RepID=A0A370QKX6_9FLAO|nr:DUF1697 domain-containing protein [Marinirhabdus gelatinilytica]RDK89025.1 uncharacterized protein (DUF1697 family) [Marinirhabdus gelatinilytica]
MKKIAFLRGINVGGHKKFPKAEQVAMAERLGLKNAEIYLHTGNWVFQSEKDTEEISNLITTEITEKYGWQVPVLVHNASKIEHILDNCPLFGEKKTKSYFILLKTAPDQKIIDRIQQLSSPLEEFFITPSCIYIYYGEGAGKAKLSSNVFEKKLGVVATARNYNTLSKVLTL